MATDILVTKLFAPLPRRNLVPRSRLIDRLHLARLQECVFARKLTLISAPAGYGKTTLVVDWIQQTKLPVAWLSLDAQDNDPAYFLAALLAALNTTRPGLADSGLPEGPGMGPLAPHMVLTPVVNAIASNSSPLILVLDDYHVIQNQAVHQTLNFLLGNLPSNLHLVIITREDPPIPLPRLRAAGQVVEIRQADLCFNREEVANFFLRSNGMEIRGEELEILAHRTEGWVVGLQMVALSLQGGVALTDFLQSLTGSHRFIMDYLIDEVFSKLSDPLQNFLLKTAILEQFSASLCDAVTDRNDSAELLASLESGNNFLIALDPVRQWYRFHHLFADLLRHKLRQSHEVQQKELHLKAGEWFSRHGDPRDAIHHALAGEDWEQAAEWIHLATRDMLNRGEIVNLLSWFARLPEDLIATHPQIALDYAWPLILSGQLEKAEILLADSSREGLPEEHHGTFAAAQAFIARSRGEYQQAMEWSQKALDQLPEEDAQTRGILGVNLAIGYWHTGQLEQSERSARDAYQASMKTNNQYAGLTSLIFLNRVQAARGQLHSAFQDYQPLRERIDPIPVLALAHMDIAGLYYEWNELDACAAHLDKCIAICKRTHNDEFESSACNQLARLQAARGDWESAAAGLDRAWRLLDNQAVTPVTRARNAAAHVQLALIQGDVIEAERWVNLAGDHADAHPFYPFAGLSRARLLLVQGHFTQARQILAALYDQSTSRQWGFAQVVILVLQALAAGSTKEALPYIEEAFSLAQPQGFQRTFIDEGILSPTTAQSLYQLLNEAVQQGIFTEYAGKLLEAFERDKTGTPHQITPKTPALVEPITERELEVLRLVAAGLTNRQIATQLVVALSTVKSHVHHISGKLGAENRTAMVARARELKII